MIIKTSESQKAKIKAFEAQLKSIITVRDAYVDSILDSANVGKEDMFEMDGDLNFVKVEKTEETND